MSDKVPEITNSRNLRISAEEIIKNRQTGGIETGDPELERLLYEFEVYQFELEIQNEELRRSAKELETARNEYFDLFDAAPVGFVILNEKGIIERCNRAASYILSGDRTPMSGRSFSSRVHRDDQGDYFSYLKAIAASKKASPRSLRIVRSDGQIVHVHMEAAGVSDSENRFTHWRLAMVDISERKSYEKELEKAHHELEDRVRERTAELEKRSNQLARLTSELTLAEQRERKRLAELLHDHLQQLLTGAKMHLDILSGEAPVENLQAYENAYNLVVESIETSRSLSSELSPPVLFQKGLSEALKWLARWMEQTHKLEVNVRGDENFPALREELRVLLFQSVRELLFNVSKHSGATTAQVDMRLLENRVQITVSDPGIGFDPESLHKVDDKEGFGIISIRERIELLGGEFKMKSACGSGTTVSLTAPLNPTVYDRRNKRREDRELKRQGTEQTTQAPQPESPGKLRVMLTDDHAVMRNGLSTLLSLHPDIEIAGEAADGEEAVDLARRIRPDVILMDVNMPHMNGMEATRRINQEMPGIRIIGLSMHDSEDQGPAMEQAGAESFLNKSGGTDTLLSAIRGEYVQE